MKFSRTTPASEPSLYLGPKRASETGYGMVVKIRLDLTLDLEKFEVDLATNRAIFPDLALRSSSTGQKVLISFDEEI